MSKLDELIRELCPDGVQVFRLEEIAHYAKTRIDCKTINEDNYVGVENLLQNKAGKTKATSVPTTGMVIAYQKNDILIGNIRPYLRKVWLADCEGGTNGDRMNDVKKRYGFYPQDKWDSNMRLKQYFEKKMKKDIYLVCEKDSFVPEEIG